MLITTDFHDVPTKLAKNGRPIRIFVMSPTVPGYPQAKFPGNEPSLNFDLPFRELTASPIRRRCIQVGQYRARKAFSLIIPL